jgi:hypothetical protein
MKKIGSIFCLWCSFFLPVLVHAQHKSTWSNKDKGTYLINYSPILIYETFADTVLCGVGVRFYELGKDSLKKLEGTITINRKKYFAYDSTGITDEDGFKYPDRFFGKFFTERVFKLKADAGSEYYPIKTEKLFLWPKTNYIFTFYFIRKDELKRN